MKKQVGRLPKDVSVIYNEQRILETLQGLSFIPVLYGSAVYSSGTRKQVKLFKHVIFMEHIDGVTLHTVLHYDRASYDLDKIKSQLNTALIEMWKRGVMHLDFHDRNILVTKESDIYIIDFGISTETDQTKDIAKDFSLDNNATDLWKTKLEKYGDSRIVQYNPTANPMWYNPNGKLLQYVKTL
jgi:tRNA A-37 threonylcarbamoyl transferase component Bud32